MLSLSTSNLAWIESVEGLGALEIKRESSSTLALFHWFLDWDRNIIHNTMLPSGTNSMIQ